MPEPLVTERLRIVPYPLDLDEALAGARIPHGWPDEELREVLDAYTARLREDSGVLGYGPWVVIACEGSVVAGSAGFLGRPDETGEIELGFGIVEEFRNRGYATEAAGALVGWALAQPGARRVVARAEPANEASNRVLVKVGFTRDRAAGELVRWTVE